MAQVVECGPSKLQWPEFKNKKKRKKNSLPKNRGLEKCFIE
jgi:hypothetical protein